MDISASAITLVALPEINDCAVLSELLDNDALALADTEDGRSAFTDAVAWPDIVAVAPIERIDSIVANAEVDVVTGLVTLEVNVALDDNADKAF